MKSVFGHFLLCALLSCGGAPSGEAQATNTISFVPLTVNEVLTSSSARVDGTTELSLFRADPAQQVTTLLFKVRHASPGKATIALGGTRAFFVVHSEDQNDFDDLWIVDGNRGQAYPLVKASPAFSVSTDGRYVCFNDLKFQVETASTAPRVTLYDVESNTTVRSYDYKAKKYSGTGPRISFEAKKRQFHLVFTAENRTMGAEDISLP